MTRQDEGDVENKYANSKITDDTEKFIICCVYTVAETKTSWCKAMNKVSP